MKKIITFCINALFQLSCLMAMEEKKGDTLNSLGNYPMARIHEMGWDENGCGHVKDLDEAALYYQKAADLGDENAIVDLARLHLNNEWPFRDPLKAQMLLTSLADKNNVQAQFYLGVMYHFGQGVPRDIEKAIKFYELAASQDNCVALHNLSHIYSLGIGVQKDELKAFEYIKRAANLGSCEHQYLMSKLYKTGSWVAKNKMLELYWLYQAVQKDYPQALFELAVMCESRGKDYEWYRKKSTKLYRKAAYLGHPKAQEALAYAHAMGIGVGKVNFIKAAKWFKRAVENGNMDAKWYLECMVKIQEMEKEKIADPLQIDGK